MASFILAVLISCLLPTAHAKPISRNEFKPSAVNYVPSLPGPISGQKELKDGILLTITGGFVVFLQVEPSGTYVYYDGYDETVITMTFTDAVSAVGMDWIANNASPTLTVFDEHHKVLESLTLDWTTFPKMGNPESPPFGFIGIDVGQDLIKYATIDTPLPGNELFVGRWIYQPPGTIPNFVSPDPTCEHCDDAYRTKDCREQEAQHPDYLSIDIMDCNYDDVNAIKDTYGCKQYVPGCDTWVCTEHIPDSVIEDISNCKPVIIGDYLKA